MTSQVWMLWVLCLQVPSAPAYLLLLQQRYVLCN
jgi:hypothetical protein